MYIYIYIHTYPSLEAGACAVEHLEQFCVLRAAPPLWVAIGKCCLPQQMLLSVSQCVVMTTSHDYHHVLSSD